MLIVTVVSIGLNLILIPLFQATGAAITVLLTNALMFVLGMLVARKIIVYNPKKNLLVFVKSSFASALMAGLIFWLKTQLPIILLVIIAASFYFFFIYLLGGFHRADLLYIIKSFKKSKGDNIETPVAGAE
jgi:peptidoglycan biosynthesis protein MviN/MurJ (putative lipid II flippase)